MKKTIPAMLQIFITLLITGTVAFAMTPPKVIKPISKDHLVVSGEVNIKKNPNTISVESKPQTTAESKKELVEPPVASQPPVEVPKELPNLSVSSNCADEIKKYDWNQSIALAISKAESGLRIDARGDTGLTYFVEDIRYGDSWGCFQIRYLPGRPVPDLLVNAIHNVAYAYKLYKSSGWKPWSMYNNGSYLKYL